MPLCLSTRTLTATRGRVLLGVEAQIEARVLMLSTRNLLLPANGRLAMAANQDIVLGCYYLTMEAGDAPADTTSLRHFYGPVEVITAYEAEEQLCSVKGHSEVERNLDLHSWIRVRIGSELITTTVGRVIFNQIIPPEVGYQNITYDKGKLNDLAMLSYDAVGQWRTAVMLDDLKELGFRYATRAGVTFSFGDIVVPARKGEIIAQSEAEVKKVFDLHQKGGITENERVGRIVDLWKKTTVRVTDEMMEELTHSRQGLNSIYMMYKSGARGSKDQIKQLGGMRGLMDKPSKIGSTGGADVIETPIKSNFYEGLTVLEYFVSTHGPVGPGGHGPQDRRRRLSHPQIGGRGAKTPSSLWKIAAPAGACAMSVLRRQRDRAISGGADSGAGISGGRCGTRHREGARQCRG